MTSLMGRELKGLLEVIEILFLVCCPCPLFVAKPKNCEVAAEQKRADRQAI